MKGDDYVYPSENINVADSGMSFRDHIAIQAMQGLLSCTEFCSEINNAAKQAEATGQEERAVHPKILASTSYLIADAMIAESNMANQQKEKDDG